MTIDALAPAVIVGSVVFTAGWIFNNWLRMRHGYPLENSWGKSVYPSSDKEAQARIGLITQENAQLRAEVSAMRERLETVERIVTDRGFNVAREIEALRTERAN
ncbi:hypothetical protein B2G71_01925 [Novosphingobium sp. PC22D]|uniref:hypothetical protein n=1 Tax=Novosphingobium sp. PC22D TaxID=1962403 RepID=UPI000BFAF378|nr:hypothetical protein [Novosphingobium sp. PC22D]PEQ14380.1 hypothetical protein B2G71_01925 [Novosphingobium sp. PC22D]